MRSRWMRGVVVVLLVVCCVWIEESAEASNATVTWTKNTEADLAGYEIYVSDVAGQFGVPNTVITDKNTTTIILDLPDLPVDKMYFFTMTAVDLAGNKSLKAQAVSKFVTAAVTFRKTVTDSPGIVWGLVGPNPSTIWRDGVQLIGRANDIRVRNGITEVQGTDPVTGVLDGNWYKWTGTNWTFSIINEPDPPPAPVQGLTVTKNTVEEVIVVTQVLDCVAVTVNQNAGTPTEHKVILNCSR